MSRAGRHFGRCRSSAGIPARRRAATASRSSVCSSGPSGPHVSSQLSGQTSRQSSGQDAASVTACTVTPIWQLATLPRLPDYCRATPGQARPSLGKPVSSTTHTRGPMAATAQAASRSRTAAGSQAEAETNCCSP